MLSPCEESTIIATTHFNLRHIIVYNTGFPGSQFIAVDYIHFDARFHDIAVARSFSYEFYWTAK